MNCNLVLIFDLWKMEGPLCIFCCLITLLYRSEVYIKEIYLAFFYVSLYIFEYLKYLNHFAIIKFVQYFFLRNPFFSDSLISYTTDCFYVKMENSQCSLNNADFGKAHDVLLEANLIRKKMLEYLGLLTQSLAE